MYTEAWKMSELSWFRKAIVSGAAALLLAGTMQTPAEADPAFFGHPRAGGQHDAIVAGNGLTAERRDEPSVASAPADDGSIIIECVALRYSDTAAGATSPPNAHRTDDIAGQGSPPMLLATPPHMPLGPTKCWPDEHRLAE